jgi:rfaE bifunctional protein kinase chain/domain
MNLSNKTVFVSGCFNILHPGHLRLLRFAKECGNNLIVGVESDLIAGNGAHIPEKLRLEGVIANSYVDSAFIFNEDIYSLIMRLKPDIIVKGKEHENQNNPELIAVKNYGGKLLFCSGESLLSSVDLLRREFNSTVFNSIGLPSNYLLRHSISNKDLIKLVQSFAKLHVCVIGDLIVDEYITCQSLGMSQEDPTIVVTPIDEKKFIGGAAIVAAHAVKMGAITDFVSVVGCDEVADYARECLNMDGLNPFLLNDDSRPTTLKKRYRSKGKSLLRVSYLHQNTISNTLKNSIYKYLSTNINKYDLIVFSDFNYGCLPQDLVDKIIKLAKKNDVFIAADSQSSSQFGDISRFKGADLLTPTEREARISLKNIDDGLVVLADKLSKLASNKYLFLKMAEEGVLIHDGNAEGGSWVTDRIDALNHAPKDVSGAGDSFLIASAMSLALGGNIWKAAVMGSLAAAIQVSRVGNTPIKAEELLNELRH